MAENIQYWHSPLGRGLFLFFLLAFALPTHAADLQSSYDAALAAEERGDLAVAAGTITQAFALACGGGDLNSILDVALDAARIHALRGDTVVGRKALDFAWAIVQEKGKAPLIDRAWRGRLSWTARFDGAQMGGLSAEASAYAKTAKRPGLRAYAVAALARVLMEQERYADADKALAEELTATGKLLSIKSAEHWRLWEIRGLLCKRQDLQRDAIEAFARAVDLAPADDGILRAGLLRLLGGVLVDAGRPKEALLVLEDAVRLSESGPAGEHLLCRAARAGAHRGLGNLQAALDDLRAAAELAGGGNNPAVLGIKRNLGALYLDLNLDEHALEILAACADSALSGLDRPLGLSAMHLMATAAYRTGHRQRALQLWNLVEVQLSPASPLASDVYFSLATAHADAGRRDSAEAIWRTLIDRSQASGDAGLAINARIELAQSLSARGKAQAALELLQTAYEEACSRRIPAAILRSGRVLSWMMLKHGEPRVAARFARTAIDAGLEMERNLSADLYRRGMAESIEDLYDALVIASAQTGDSALAFAAAEEGRARPYVHLIRSRGRKPKPPAKSAQSGQSRRWERILATMESESARDRRDTAPDPMPPLLLADVQRRALASGRSVVTFWLTSDTVYSWIISRSAVEFRQVGIHREIVVATILELLSDTCRKSAPEFDRTARTLQKLLFGPAVLSLGGTMQIVPHRELYFVPFPVMPLFRGRPAVLTFTARSGSSWNHRPYSVTAVGSPEVPGTAMLPEAAREAWNIAALYPDSALMLFDTATEARFRLRANRAEILHLACHASQGAVNSMYNALHLTADKEADGNVEAWEISWMDLARVRLAVLSACATQHGALSAGSDPQGLVRSFHAAGVNRVVATLWPVSDAYSRAVMVGFHERLARGEPPESALMASVTDVRAANPIELDKPWFWAPYVLTEAPGL